MRSQRLHSATSSLSCCFFRDNSGPCLGDFPRCLYDFFGTSVALETLCILVCLAYARIKQRNEQTQGDGEDSKPQASHGNPPHFFIKLKLEKYFRVCSKKSIYVQPFFKYRQNSPITLGYGICAHLLIFYFWSGFFISDSRITLFPQGFLLLLLQNMLLSLCIIILYGIAGL